MKQKNIFIYIVLISALVWCAAPHASARYYNEAQSLEIRGQITSKLTFKTQDTKGWFTQPSMVPDRITPQLDAWDIIQHRNLAYIEMDYDFSKQSEHDVQLHATGRFLYDGAYEYGADALQRVREFDAKTIDDFTRDADIWELYANITRGPWLLRVGRQKISWGKTDVFPMLDRIMPIDNTYGGLFESLDDRRIPLWALRTTYNLGDFGSISSLGIDAFWEPGFVDQQFAPQSPWGTVYNFPQPSPPPYPQVIKPDGDMDSSRWGFRLQGILFNNLDLSLAHYRTYPNDPALKLRIDPEILMQGDLHGLVVEKHFKQVDITGGSFSYFSSTIEAVIRGELGYFWDEPAFDPNQNFAALAFLSTGQLVESTIPEWDVLRFSLALDKPFWIRSLNERSMFNLTIESFNEYYPDYKDSFKLPAPIWDVNKLANPDFVDVNKWEHTVIANLYTSYWSGKLTPSVLVAYNLDGAGFWEPAIEYRMDPWKFKVQYDGVFGDKDIPPGVLFDSDQVAFIATLMF